MKKLVSIVVMLVLLTSMFLMVANVNASVSNLPEACAVKDSSVEAKGDVIVEDPVALPGHHSYYVVGDVATWICANTYTGQFFTRNFMLKGMTSHAEIWTSTYPFPGPYTDNYDWQVGDPRSTPVITDAELTYLLNEFENQIYPTDVLNFGAPAVRDGSGAAFGPPGYYEGSTRVAILIMNIRDRNYYVPSYPYYVAGYFDPTITGYFTDRDVVTIDSYQWEARLGPAGTVWPPPAPAYPGGVDRPYVYDSTLAHEFQHLIHNDWNPSDDAFMNEGCSMYAEYLCGFGIDPSYINSYFYTPSNSLTDWSDQGDINILADYGESALWAIYLSDHFGGANFITYFVQAGIPGIDGVNAALAFFGFKKTTFDTVFHDWRIANLIHTNSPGKGIYNYKSINLDDPSLIPMMLFPESGVPVPQTDATTAFRPPPDGVITILNNPTGVTTLGPYSSDYIKFTDWKKPGFIYFDGDDLAIYGWRYDATYGYWWSGYGNQMDTKLTGQAHVDPMNPVLTLVTAYGLETNYDYGCVQVSTDNGQTWTSLVNAYTSSDYYGDMQIIFDNLPGLNDYNPSWPNWDTMTFDLSAYAGMNVMISFRYLTDEFTNYEGWFIQSASVSGTPLTLAATYPKATFQVTVIQAIVMYGKTIYLPWDMQLTKDTNKGMSIGAALKPSYVLLVVSPTMHQGFTDYKFQATKLPLFKFC